MATTVLTKARPRQRDNQRSRVYAWERSAIDPAHRLACFATSEEVSAWLSPIWRKERARVGLAGTPAPTVTRAHRGQLRPYAHHDHRISLPKWARSTWVALHELAHRLTPQDEAHGPRFVGVLIGLGCRHLDLDAAELMRAADQAGVKYHVRSIGNVPVHGPMWHLSRALATEGPMTPVEAACWLDLGTGVDVSAKQVRGAALALVRAGRARWYRKKLHLINAAAG